MSDTATGTNGKSARGGGSETSNSQSRSRKGGEKSAREGLSDVLKDALRDIYYAEKQLAKALKKMSKAASEQTLKDAFTTHMQQTEEQIELLATAFEEIGLRMQGKRCPAMDGLIEESMEHVEEMDKGAALDAALIVGAQKVEHYEMAAYGSMRAFATDLGYQESARVFEQILQQESETNELLTEIAQTVNQKALAADQEADEDLSEEADDVEATSTDGKEEVQASNSKATKGATSRG